MLIVLDILIQHCFFVKKVNIQEEKTSHFFIFCKASNNQHICEIMRTIETSMFYLLGQVQFEASIIVKYLIVIWYCYYYYYFKEFKI